MCVCVRESECVVLLFNKGFVHMYIRINVFQEEKSLRLDQISSYVSIG
jgi:hypothetical protein